MNHVEIMRAQGYAPAAEVAEAIGRSLSTVHRWANAGKLDSTRSDRRLFISLKSLRSLFDGNEVMLKRVEVLRAR